VENQTPENLSFLQHVGRKNALRVYGFAWEKQVQSEDRTCFLD
jgi:hypothetical protein